MPNKYKTEILLWAEAIALLILLTLTFISIRGCVNANQKKAKSQVCSKEGEVVQNQCPTGQTGRIFQICKNGKYEQTFNDCQASSCQGVVFDQNLKPLIDSKCVSCHSGFNTIEVAKGKIDEMIRRVGLPDSDGQRMPKAPNPALSEDEKALFSEWKADGFLPTCEDGAKNNNPHLDSNYVEDALDQDLEGLSSADQKDARYLIISHKSDEGADLKVLKQFVAGIQKATNSLSFAREISLAQPVDQYKTIYRLSLRDLKLSAADWKLIEDHELVNLESFTNKGLLLKQLTGARKPWLHIDSFAFSANQPDVYYQLRKLPKTENELFAQLGVNFNQELQDLTALHVGFANSPIALNKNRLITRFDADDGELFITFDVDANQNSADRNLFQFPLLKSASGKANFRFDASEFIFSLANGLHGYFLANAQGQRVNAAPLTVVADNISPFSPEIKAGISCYRCHSGGYIKAKDEVKAHVDENAALFDLADVDFVDELYRDPTADFNRDNALYAAALSKMGIDISESDPVNLTADNLRRNMNAQAVAALLLLTKEEFLEGLNRSAEGRQQVGSLLTGGEITFQQLVATLPILIRDLRLGQNPL